MAIEHRYDEWSEEVRRDEALEALEAVLVPDVARQLARVTALQYNRRPLLPGLVRVGRTVRITTLTRRLVADERFVQEVGAFAESVSEVFRDLMEDEVPEDRHLFYRKIERRDFSYEAVEAEVHASCAGLREAIGHPLAAEDVALQRRHHHADARLDAFHDAFKTALHVALKKVVCDHFPAIFSLSGTGLRELEFLTYLHMKEMYDLLLGMLEDVFDADVDCVLYADLEDGDVMVLWPERR